MDIVAGWSYISQGQPDHLIVKSIIDSIKIQKRKGVGRAAKKKNLTKQSVLNILVVRLCINCLRK